MKINLRREFVLVIILAIAFFIRFFRLSELMIFGGDVAREYIAARDMILQGNIPLIGCPTSIIWLHQGPIFVYLLGIILPFGKFNPLTGGVFFSFIGVISVFVIYKLGSILFSKSTGLYGALLYSTSPLVVLFDRYPYYHSLISLVIMLFFLSLYYSFNPPSRNSPVVSSNEVENIFRYGRIFPPLAGSRQPAVTALTKPGTRRYLAKRIVENSLQSGSESFKKNTKYILLSFLLFGILMQLELSSIIFFPVLALLVLDFHKQIKLKYLISGIFIFIFTWTAKIIYDFSSGFTQTVGYIYWLGYRILPLKIGNKTAGFYPLDLRFSKIFTEFQKMIFWPSFWISIFILTACLYFLIKNFSIKHRREHLGEYLIILWFIFPVTALFIHGSPEGSYSPALFALPGLLIGNFVNKQKSYLKLILIGLMVVLVFYNAVFLINNDYFMITGHDTKYKQKYNFGEPIQAAKEIALYIVNDSRGEKFNLIPLGDFAYFPSAKQNLVYLSWYFGNQPSEKEEKIKYFVYYKYDKKEIVGVNYSKEFPNMIISKRITE